MLLQQPIMPVIVEVVGKPTREVGLADVLLEAVGLTGAIVLGSALFGLLLGGILIWLHFKRPGADARTPAATDYGFRLSSSALGGPKGPPLPSTPDLHV